MFKKWFKKPTPEEVRQQHLLETEHSLANAKLEAEFANHMVTLLTARKERLTAESTAHANKTIISPNFMKGVRQ